MTTDVFDGLGLYAAVCAHDLEGVVAKRLASRYWPRERRWVKVKNPNYWRRDFEIEAMQRSRVRPSYRASIV